MKQSKDLSDILRIVFVYLKKQEDRLDSSIERCLVSEMDENGTIVKTPDYIISISLVRNGAPRIEIAIRGDVVAVDGTKTSQWTNSDWKNLVAADSRFKIVQQKISDEGSTVTVATLSLLIDWTVWGEEPPISELDNIWNQVLNVLQKLREMLLSR